MRNKPADVLNSVDRALRLIHLLRDQGVVSVTEAGELLGVSRSAAHRLLTTLCYRDFAEQASDRRYRAGPALHLHPHGVQPIRVLREVFLPVMRRLAIAQSETVTLGILVDGSLRIVATAESPRLLRVGDQEGTVLPAYLAAGGKAILALLSEEEIRQMYGPLDGSHPLTVNAWRLLRSELRRVAETGYAVNHGEAEAGVSAIGMSVTVGAGRAIAGLAFAMPSARFSVDDVPRFVTALREAIAQSTPALSAAEFVDAEDER